MTTESHMPTRAVIYLDKADPRCTSLNVALSLLAYTFHTPVDVYDIMDKDSHYGRGRSYDLVIRPSNLHEINREAFDISNHVGAESKSLQVYEY